jgi:branched-chain amino acid transport system ATP-binding protein
MAHELVRAGLGFVPQTDNVFTHMPISDNLRLAADILPKTERRSQIESMYVLFPDLARRPQLEAGRLSGGQRQMLAIARALIPRPQLLLLDEASAGLSPKLVGELLVKLRQIKAQGVTILLVEQNAKAALGAADRAVILNGGQIAHEGSCADLLRDRSIGQLFFGLKPKGTVV